MKVFLSLLVSVAIASPAFAGITANGSYDDERAVFQSQEEVDFVIFEEGFDVPSTNAYKNFTIHWTSSFSQDWCMWIETNTGNPFVILDGGITGTICGSGNWSIESITPLGGGTYELHATGTAQGCATELCMIGTKSGSNVNDTRYGWNGGCDSFPMEGGSVNGCDF